MRLTVVYDKKVARDGLGSGWGFSCHIEIGKESILFDTGWDGKLLLGNLKALGIDAKGISRLLLSHAHWDHIGGLPEVLDLNPELTVYAPRSFSKNLKDEIASRAKLVEVFGPMRIAPGCTSTGELGSGVVEQSLLVKTERGLVVVTGCAHPTLRRILGTARDIGRIHAIVGGFHTFRDFEVLKGASAIMPCHCTSQKTGIGEHYPDALIESGAGSTLEIGEPRDGENVP